MANDSKLTRKERNLRAQLNNEENNPCYKEHVFSLNCLAQNNYNGEVCQNHFANYRTCRTFWHAVIRKRRNEGIEPHLPPLEERQTIKDNFLKKGAL
ncbi:coiled-coil-helix-coiled-coil-helix domain-containing protein 7 [Cimex lectularius]|uniref:Coiled-coil-helix-coiled-coil-helix domain-containing protein 7 n=1 Tax=Cimex lectularius TaxID=79782 RepID=A0A8I6SB73_CIMLE|nr:coiled-coil-helix-coiled-coil-helix domain-containing protein 7 [Cimex lectularius]